MTRNARPWLPLLLLLLAGACDRDSFDRPGTVTARGLNEANLRAMVANPAHLQRGVEAGTSRGAVAAEAVDRLRRGQRQALPSASQQNNMTVNMIGGQDAAR